MRQPRHTGRVPDLRLLVDDVAFAVRAVLVCQRGGKLLVESGDYPFQNLPGGALLTGEALADGAAREWHEETGLKAQVVRLLGLVENFFKLNGRCWHELGFYFGVDAQDALPDGPFVVSDNTANVLKWVDPLAEMDRPTYPTAALKLLDVPEGKFRHIINREAERPPAQDLRLDVHGTAFQLRVHLIYVQDGQLLTNTVPGSGFWFLPGGSVLLNEDSLTAARREFHEETGLHAQSARLVGITEGFDRRTNRQQLGLCYRVETEERLPTRAFPVRDHDELQMQWVPLAEVESKPVHPRGLSKMLDVPEGGVEHSLIEWETD